MRKIVQITSTALSPTNIDEARQRDEEFVVTALCDDGTVWVIQPDRIDAKWEKLPPIPPTN